MRLRATFEHPRAEHYSRRGGPWDVPSLAELLGTRRDRGIAVVDGAVNLDHAQFLADTQALAGGLHELGVGHGDVVSWQLPNWFEAVMFYRACWHLGAIASPLHHRFGAGDLHGVLQALEPAVVFSAPDLPLADLEGAVIIRGDTDAFDELLTKPPVDPIDISGEAIAVAMLTSGSTGEPKIVLHTHRALAYKARVQQQVHGLTADDVVLLPAPLSHVSGLVNGVLLPGSSGMKVVLMDVWNPDTALALIEREQVSFIGGPAVFLTSLVEGDGFATSRVRTLRVASMGGSSMTPAALTLLGDRLGCVVKRTYGATEAPTITTWHVGDPEDRGRETDGRSIAEAEVIVVDPADGARRTPGEVGEIWIRGPEMFAGYALNGQTADAIADGGWLRTGDLGVLDDEGWLTVVGRIKELIIRGGENIATAEVESILESHPGVRQAVAVGYPDPVLGERVAAVVVAESDFDLDGVRRLFSERGVARFKTPEAVLHVESIPVTATGKVDRAALRTYAARILTNEAAKR